MHFRSIQPTRVRSLGIFALGALFAILIGCAGKDGPTLVPVHGKVLNNGKGVTAGSIYFHPDADAEYTKDKPSSMLQIDGSFTLKTFPFGEGIAAGNYTVTLAPELAQRLKKPDYGAPSSSPWKITVPPDGIPELVLNVK